MGLASVRKTNIKVPVNKKAATDVGIAVFVIFLISCLGYFYHSYI